MPEKVSKLTIISIGWYTVYKKRLHFCRQNQPHPQPLLLKEKGL
jgi:hypothetical protein